MTIAEFTVEGRPETKGSAKAFRHRGTGKIIVRNDNEKCAGWSRAVGWSARAAMRGAQPISGPVSSGSYRVDLDELVDRFYSDDRALVITTNLVYPSAKARAERKAKGQKVDESAPTFADRYGERVLDRMRECGRWVDTAAPSMRGAR